MIHVYGTSHVSEDSFELIERKLEQHDPEIVAIELDLVRLNSMLNDSPEKGGTAFMQVLKKFQEFIGSGTGVMPGDEMIYAYNTALNQGREVALIDQDIRITMDRLKAVPRKEKARAVLESAAGLILPGKLDVSEIPGEELIAELLDEMHQRYPELYRVLVTERNQVMADSLRALKEDNPDAEIVAFVGAGHREDLEELVETN